MSEDRTEGRAGSDGLAAASEATFVPQSRSSNADRRSRLVPLGITLVGLALTLAACVWLRSQERWRLRQEFALDTEHSIHHLESALRGVVGKVRALAAMLEVEEFTRSDFVVLADRLMEGHDSAILLATASAEPADDVDRVSTLLSTVHAIPVRVWQATPLGADAGPAANTILPIDAVHPRDIHTYLLGFDLFSGHPWTDRVRRVYDEGGYAVIGPVRLGWIPDNPVGLFVVACGSPHGRAPMALCALDLQRAIDDSSHELGVHGVPLNIVDELTVPLFPIPAELPGAVPDPSPTPAEAPGSPVQIGNVHLSFRPAVDPPAPEPLGPAVLGVLLAGTVCSCTAGWFAGGRLRAARRLETKSAELARVNASLRDSEERFRLALRSVAGIVYSWEVRDNVVTRSEGIIDVLGYATDELPLTLEGWVSIIHPDDAAVAFKRFEIARDTSGSYDVEYRVRHKNGEYVEVRDRGVVLRDDAGEVRKVVGCTMSLAGQRRAEEAVRDAERRLAHFADAINDVLWTVEASPLRVVYLSPAFERVWGIPPEQVYRDPEAWLEAVHPEDRDRVTAESRVWGLPTSPRSRQIEYRIRRADGATRWIRDTAVRLDPEGDRPVQVVGVAEDITDRKVAEIALQESEHAYRQLFDASVTASIVFDPADCRIVQANTAAARFYGYSAEHLATMSIFDLCCGGHENLRDDLLRSPEPPARLESRHRSASGEERDVEVFSSLIQRQGRPMVYSIIHDITERKRVAAELENSQRTLEQAQAVGRIGSWVYSPSDDGRLLWSSQVYRIFGLTPQEYDHRVSTFYRFVHPDDREAVVAAVTEAIRERTPYRIDHRIVRPDGAVRWVHEQGEVEYGDGGEATRIVGVVQDITERREAEQALRDSQELLRTTLDSLAEGCIAHGIDGRILMCNDSAECILGISRQEMLEGTTDDGRWMLFREDGSRMPPEEYPSNISVRTGTHIEGAVVGIRGSGPAPRWISINCRPLRAGDGRVIGAVVSFSDVTERRAAAMALQHTARRYQLLFDSNPEPLWVYDTGSLRFLAVNQAAVDTYGYSREEFLAMTLLQIRPEAERERLMAHVRSAPARDRHRGIWLHQVKGGRLMDVEIISHAMEFEGRPARIVLAKDITERLGAERALRDSEARLREAQRIGRVGDWEFDPAAGRITWSDEVFRLYARDPALGPPATLAENLRLYAPEDAHRLANAVRSALEHGTDASLDLHVLHSGGEEAWHRAVINAVRDRSGAIVGLRGVVQDITDRKRAEDALRATQLRLATILEHMPDVVVYESDGRHIFPSENIQSLVGVPAETFERDRNAFRRLIHPRDITEADRADAFVARHAAHETLVIQYRLRHRDGHYIWIEDRMVREDRLNGHSTVLGVLIDVSERKRTEQRQRLMMAELDHRVKNNLATVISLLDQTGRTAKSVADFHQTFLGRVQALARMHKALSQTHWQGVSFRAILAQTVEPYQSDPPGRITLVGDDVTLPARAVSPIAMALHELATNAVKYGSLSVAAGRVRVEWHVAPDPEGVPQLHLRWEESDGPPVVPPSSSGFGTELITGGVAYELHGEARIDFEPAGIRCIMRVPLAQSPPGVLPLPPFTPLADLG